MATMFRSFIRRKSFWLCIALGEVLAFLCVFFLLSKHLRIKTILQPLCYPVDVVIAWYANTFLRGATDQMMTTGMLSFLLYWFILGFLAGLVFFGVACGIKRIVLRK